MIPSPSPNGILTAPDASLSALPVTNPNILAAIDIGTNSMRLSVVQLNPEAGTWATMMQEKLTVRLGQDEFATHRLSEEAIARGVLALRKLVEIAKGYAAGEIIALATAALREAVNREEFLHRARTEAGVEVQVVPGVEEARLIYLGVTSGIELGEQKGLFIDIGGGSTELIVGTQNKHLMLDSLKVGAIRMGNRYLEGVTGPVSTELFDKIRQDVQNVATHSVRNIRALGFDVAVASSGTAMNLAQVAARERGEELTTIRNYTLTMQDLVTVTRNLQRMTLEERRRVPGLNPERADIIISGAAILQTLGEMLDIRGFVIADRSLREGILVDALLRRTGTDRYEAGVRRRSIETLGDLMAREREHAAHVARLSLSLFDQAKEIGLHDYDPHERELLEYAALLHDVGIFISRAGHHRHSYYLIRHSELAGFTDEEIQIIANLAYFHRKSPPKRSHAHFQALSRDNQKMVRRLSALLRLAEGMDRSHLGLIPDARLTRDGKAARLTLLSPTDPHLEEWYVGNETSIFAEAFGLPLTVEVAGSRS